MIQIFKHVTTYIEICRQPAILTELMSDLCIKISECIPDALFIRLVYLVEESECRNCSDLCPGSSEADIERCLILPDRSFKLETSVDQSYGEVSMEFLEVSVSCGHIYHRRQL